MYGEHQTSYTFLNENRALVFRKSYLEIGPQRIHLRQHENEKKEIFLIQEETDEEIEN